LLPALTRSDHGFCFFERIYEIGEGIDRKDMLVIVAAPVLVNALVLVADTLRGWPIGNQWFALWRQRLTGAVLIGLGGRLALTRRD
jgi:hypothetical protein